MSDIVLKLTGEPESAQKAIKLVEKDIKEFSKNAEKDLSEITKSFTQEIKGLSSQLNTVGLIAGGVFASISAFVYKSIDAFKEQEKATRQVEQAIKNTGNAANVSIKQIEDLASEIQGYSNYADEAVLSSSKLLLSVKNLTNEGFVRSQKAVVDLAAAMDGDLHGATLAIAKAMENPVEGLGALSRANVRFTEEQKKTIEIMVQSGQTLQAQEYILTALESKYSGFAKSGADSFTQFKNEVGDIMEEFGKVFSEEIKGVVDFARELARELKENKELIRVFADGLIIIGKAAAVIVGAVGAIKVISGIATGIEAVSVAVATGSIAMRTFVGATGIGLLLIVLPDVINLLKDFWGALSGESTGPIDIASIEQVNSALRVLQSELEKTQNQIRIMKESGGYSDAEMAPFIERERKFQENILNLKKDAAAKQEELRIAERDKMDAEQSEKWGKEAERIQLEKDLKAKEAADKLKKSEEDRAAELEKSEEKYQEDLEILALRREAELISEEEFNQQKDDLKTIHEAKVKGSSEILAKEQIDIRKKLNDQLIENEKKKQAMDAEIMSSGMNLITSIMKKGSKEQFLVTQVAALGTAIMKTAEAIAVASATPPAPNVGLALKAGILGGIQIATIAAQTIQGFAKGGLVTGGIPGVDSVPIIAQKNEFVQPAKNYEQVIQSEMATRNLVRGNDTQNQQPQEANVNLVVGFTDNAIEIIEQKLDTRIRLGISSLSRLQGAS